MSLQKATYGFVPTSITGCALWLDGADSGTMFQNTAATTPITADGQTIAAWKDKSPNAYVFTQPTSGNQPTYKVGIQNGCSLTRWNGTSTGLQSSTTLPFYTSASSGGSFFFVFMITSNSSQRFLMTYQNQTSGTFCVSESEIGCPTGNVDTGNFGIHQGCSKANVALNQTTTNTYMMMNLNLLSSGTAPANTTIFKNGTSSAMTAQNGGFYSGTTYPHTNNARYLNIGYRVPVGTYPIDCWLAGDIGEIVWYQNPVSDTQRQQVEGYLAQKWGLTSSLPSSHPGRSTTLYRSDYTKQNVMTALPYYAAFTPRQISGCALWLDAADPAGNGVIPANNSTLSTWVDKSGNGVNMTGSSLQPTFLTTAYNGKPTVSFAAVQGSSYQTLSNASTNLYNSVNNISIFIAIYIPATTPNFPSPISLFGIVTIYMRGGSAGGIGAGNLYPWSFNNNGNFVFSLNNFVSVNNYYICCFQFDTNQTFFMNGDTGTGGPTAFTLGSSTNIPIYIGYSGYNASDGFNGYISEIITYNTAVSTAQRQQIESYLAQKWGLTASLPGGHSHATQPAGAVTKTALANLSLVVQPRRYTSFRWTITAGNTESLIQFSEFQVGFNGTQLVFASPTTATTGSSISWNTGAGEGPAQAVDNNLNTKGLGIGTSGLVLIVTVAGRRSSPSMSGTSTTAPSGSI